MGNFLHEGQFNVGMLIRELEALPKSQSVSEVRFDFGYFRPSGLSSWRGDYSELAIEYANEGEVWTVQRMLHELRNAVGKGFSGYKGGTYYMSEKTPLWVANAGEAANTIVAGLTDTGSTIIIDTAFRDY